MRSACLIARGDTIQIDGSEEAVSMTEPRLQQLRSIRAHTAGSTPKT
jgi:hypothetical protein